MKNWEIVNSTKILILVLLSFYSCDFYQTELPVDLPAPKPKLVVHSTFTPFDLPALVKTFSVSVSQSAGVFDTSKIVPIPDATVSLFLDGKFDQILKYSSASGRYGSNFYPKPGVEYSILVEKQGVETVMAKNTIPTKIPIKSCELISFAGFGDANLAFSQLSVTFDDPVDQINFYEIMLLNYQREEDKNRLTTNDKIIISESYYPSPILMDANLPNRLLFSDRLINGKTHTTQISFIPGQVIKRGTLYIVPNFLYLVFRSVSKEYYQYYTSLLTQSNNRNPDMLFGIAEPGQVYTNIQNGYGLFAGYAEDTRSFWVDSVKVR